MIAPNSPAAFAPSRHDDEDASYREPLSTSMRLGVLALVIFFHVGGAWALISIEPSKIEIGDVAPMEVRMVPGEQPAQPEPELTPPPDDTPPPEVPMVESMIQPPLPDLPPPEFPVQVQPPKPPPPKPKPTLAPVKPQQAAAPAAAPAQQTQTATATAAPETVSILQVRYTVPPNLVYPARSRRAGEQGTTVIRAYVDASGVPAQVSVERSSGHPALDEAAIAAMRGARVRTSGRALWVVGPFEFKLQQ
jgi:periplasmic protein TonB